MPNPYNYFPASYQTPYNPYMQMPQQIPQQAQQTQQPQIQNGGLVTVRSKTEAQNYPVAPGNSVTFKDETAPFVYTKTMGFSQLDRPIFETFRLVKEDTGENLSEGSSNSGDSLLSIDLSIYATKDEIKPILERLEALEAKRIKKKEDKNDD